MTPQESQPGEQTYAGDYRAQQEAAAEQDDGWWLRELLARFEAHRRANEFALNQAQRLEQGVETRKGPALPGTHYPGFDHPTLKSMVETNLDAGQVNETGAAWNELGNALVDLQTEVSAAVGRSEADWSGAAGGAARGYVSGLGGWMGGTGQGFQLAAARMNAESEAAARAKNSMPEPVEFSMKDALDMLRNERNPFNLQNTIDQINQKFDEKQQAHDRAAEVMSTYASSMGESGSGMPAFAPVPTMAGASGGETGGPGEPDDGPGGRPGGPSFPLSSGAWEAGPGDGGRDGGDGGEVVRDSGTAGNRDDADGGDSSGGDTPGQGVQPSRGPVGGGGRPEVHSPGGAELPGLPVGGLPVGGFPFGGPGSEGGRGAGSGRGGGPGGPRGVGSGGGFGGGPGAGPGPGVRGMPGAIAAEQAALGRGGVGAPGGGRGTAGVGMSPIGAGRPQGGEDSEHKRPGWLVEGDPEGLFGSDELTAPPVLGADEPVSEER